MDNIIKQKDCCNGDKSKTEKKGFFNGLLYGIIPHTFCIAFIVFSIIGATTATAVFKKFLLIPNFFYILTGVSFVFATFSAIIYLKRNGILSRKRIKRNWKYLLILYFTTVFVNLLFFTVIFPYTANLDLRSRLTASIDETNYSTITLEVAIPCPGHAPLITDEVQKINGVISVKFRESNLFDIIYNPLKVSAGEILSLDIFKTYKATIKWQKPY